MTNGDTTCDPVQLHLFYVSHHWIVWYYKNVQLIAKASRPNNSESQEWCWHASTKNWQEEPKNPNWNRMMPEDTGIMPLFTPLHWPILLWFKWLKVLGQWPKPSALQENKVKTASQNRRHPKSWHCRTRTCCPIGDWRCRDGSVITTAICKD